MKNIDHERCSELLLPYLEADLEPSLRERVEEHLRSCTDCSEEKAALQRLLAPEVRPMSAAERERLRGGVAEQLAPVDKEKDEIPVARPARPSRWARAIPALGALALIALAAVFAASLLSGNAGDGSANLESGGGGGAGLADPAAPEAAEGADAGGAGTRVPYFKQGRKRISQDTLDRVVQKEPALKALAGVNEEKAFTLTNRYTSELSAQAPGETKEQVRDCAQTVARTQGPVVPAFGYEGIYKGKDTLLVGFVSGDRTGPLNRYMLWLWPKGSCDAPLGYVSGTIKK
jgi:hypothetical protein